MKQAIAAVAVLAILAALIALSMMGREDDDTDAPQAVVEAEAPQEAGDAAAVGDETAVPEIVEEVAEPSAPSFDVVRVERSGEGVMAGRAEPGAAVSIVTRDGTLAETTADARGEWVVILDEPLAPGSHEIWIEARTGDGEATESLDAVVMVVPEPSSDVAAAETGDALAVVLPREETGAAHLLQTPEAGIGISGGGALVLESLAYDEAGGVVLAGRAEPGAEVVPYVDDVPAGRATADEEGAWQVVLDAPVEPGIHTLRVDQVGAEGAVTARLETPFQQAALVRPTAAEPVVVIQPGNNLWLIARHVYGRGVLYTQIFEANRDQIRDPDLIYPGQIFVLPEPGAGG